jgi:4,5-DOPA dioxygenase extradiol
MKKFPTLYVNHGSPYHIITETSASNFWKTIKEYLPSKPKGILALSGHWEKENDYLEITGEEPKQIYDFYGFPDKLYKVKYEPKGSIELIERTIELLNKKGFKTKINKKRGLDHGTWCPLIRMFPNADIPVVQLTLGSTIKENLEIGKALGPLREEGYLIYCSGAITHNLSLIFKMMDGEGTKEEKQKLKLFVEDINEIVKSKTNESWEKILKIDENKNYKISIGNTDDHFKPFPCILGTQDDDNEVHGKILHESDDSGLSMNIYLFE